jgi:NTE family protein
MLAMEKYERLYQVWNTISNDGVYTGGFNLWSTIKLLFGAKSFYGNEPLYRLLKQELEPQKIKADLRIGAVSLITGEYVEFKKDEPRFAEAVLASTVMPVIWTPVDISETYRSMVDGGVRNITPIGDVLDQEPDEIVIINCGSEQETALPAPPANVVNIGLRTLDILLNELFRGDMQQFLRVNYLVKEAEDHGVTLHSSNSGKALKYYSCKIIEPTTALGDTLDFSQPTVQASLKAGWDQAKAVLG